MAVLDVLVMPLSIGMTKTLVMLAYNLVPRASV
jgi:hypothetical protein